MRLTLIAAVLLAVVGTPALSSAAGSRTISLGSSVTFTGQTGSRAGSQSTVRATGVVAVFASRNHGGWHLVTKTRTDARGRYRATITPSNRGEYDLRLETPDGRRLAFVVHVI